MQFIPKGRVAHAEISPIITFEVRKMLSRKSLLYPTLFLIFATLSAQAQSPVPWQRQYKIKPNDQCAYCEGQVENIEHLFVHCERVARVWNKIGTILDGLGQGKCPSFKEIIVGNPNWSETVNKIFLHIKYFIFLNKDTTKEYSIKHLKNFLRTQKLSKNLVILFNKF